MNPGASSITSSWRDAILSPDISPKRVLRRFVWNCWGTGRVQMEFRVPPLLMPISANVTDTLTGSSLEWVFYSERS